jgi:hypothetical protein
MEKKQPTDQLGLDAPGLVIREIVGFILILIKVWISSIHQKPTETAINRGNIYNFIGWRRLVPEKVH